MISERAVVAASARVWDGAQVREEARIGDRAVVGKGAYIGVGVQVGPDSKIQNYAMLYEPCSLSEGVFVGPGAILTNDRFPRAVNPDQTQKQKADWEPVGVVVEQGASIGAGAICVAPLVIGCWSVVGAGSVVTRDVRDFALVVGSPARQIGWVGRSGRRLQALPGESEVWICPSTSDTYHLHKGVMRLAKGIT